jgi:hypothetical protein
VKVYNGDKSRLLGFGNYTENVPVYVMVMPDGSLRSLGNAEQKPDEVPKIVMDDGSVKYGCQVWWERVVEDVVLTETPGYDPWATDEEL